MCFKFSKTVLMIQRVDKKQDRAMTLQWCITIVCLVLFYVTPISRRRPLPHSCLLGGSVIAVTLKTICVPYSCLLGGSVIAVTLKMICCYIHISVVTVLAVVAWVIPSSDVLITAEYKRHSRFSRKPKVHLPCCQEHTTDLMPSVHISLLIYNYVVCMWVTV
jgi:hypothetical protein